MNTAVRKYLVDNLAPVLSQRFKLNLQEVTEVINTFDHDSHLNQTPPKKNQTPKKPTKNDLLGKAKELGLKVTTKMKKDEIEALINAANLNTNTVEAGSSINSNEPKERAAAIAAPVTRATIKATQILEGKSFNSLSGNTWTFGKLLGNGGFGAVYEIVDHPKLVIKTGSHLLKKGQDSGIFLEKAVYIKLKDSESGDSYGIPQIEDSGKLPSGIRERDYFIVMPKFDVSLEELINTNKIESKSQVMNDILRSLNYLSKKSYLHLDIKPENIMMKDDHWYLIDYGVAEKFNKDKETTINPKKAGNGTPWYMARDAHKGQMSRKADLESLVYTMLRIEGVSLPWCKEKNKGESDKDYHNFILEEKQKLFNNYKQLNLPVSCNKFIEYVDKLKPGSEPKYNFEF
jgi:hypothetical protein